MAYGDNISRQQAIDALNEYFVRIGKLKRRGLNKGEKAIRLDTVGAINSLPPAQPEIIHCKDCIHNKEPDFGFCEWANHHVSANSCCADVFHAERRTDG